MKTVCLFPVSSRFSCEKFTLSLCDRMKEKTIEIRNLSIGYKIRKSLKPVAESLCSVIYSGELTCLLGINGVGKSTLLRTLSGFQPKLSGEIFIRGKEIDSYSNRELSRMLGVVLTEKTNVRDMSVVELVSLGRSPYSGFWGSLNETDKTLVKEAIRLIKIENLAHRPIQTLSDGERQKVMIAKTLVQETPVIYLDEPTAYLDFPSKIEIMRLLHRLTRQTNKTIFLSTHDLELAIQMADKLCLMDKEKGIITGTPLELSMNGILEQFFECEGVVFERETGFFRINQ
jgi:iron complex transport system ATP-binding protein